MVCRPRYADECANCFLARKKWRAGIEMDQEEKRENDREVVSVVMEVKKKKMKGKGMRESAIRWKEMAQEAAMCGGSSYDKHGEVTRGHE